MLSIKSKLKSERFGISGSSALSARAFFDYALERGRLKRVENNLHLLSREIEEKERKKVAAARTDLNDSFCRALFEKEPLMEEARKNASAELITRIEGELLELAGDAADKMKSARSNIVSGILEGCLGIGAFVAGALKGNGFLLFFGGAIAAFGFARVKRHAKLLSDGHIAFAKRTKEAAAVISEVLGDIKNITTG